MTRQLSAAGFGAAPRLTDRLYIAIFPDVGAAARMARLAQDLRVEHGLQGRPLAAERFHVTLHYLGDYPSLPRDVIAAVGEAAAAVAMPSFEVAFDRASSFSRRPRNRPLVLRGGDDLAALTAFQQILGRSMKAAGLARWVESRYTPHVTLLYDDRRVAEQAVETIRWTAREFVLMDSLLGQRQHVPLARWPLRA